MNRNTGEFSGLGGGRASTPPGRARAPARRGARGRQRLRRVRL